MPEKPASIKLFKCVSAHFADAFVFSNEFPGLTAERLDGIQKRLPVGIGGQEIAWTELLRKRTHGALYKYGRDTDGYIAWPDSSGSKKYACILIKQLFAEDPPCRQFQGEKGPGHCVTQCPGTSHFLIRQESVFYGFVLL